jgi:cyclic pyranopterin phosphate synthase
MGDGPKKIYIKSMEMNHFDEAGNAIMVDVSGKDITARRAIAKGHITAGEETLQAVRGGGSAKGDVLGAARIAGILAAKRTAELIPLCHPLSFDACSIDFEILDGRIEAVCTVKLSGRTGVEMEALTGVSIALLTIYDMCKAMDRGMVIGGIRLWEKRGGKSGVFIRPE